MPSYGRIPSPPDDRDYNLANFVHLGKEKVDADAAELASLAIAELKLTTVTYKKWASLTYPDVTQTHWWKALNALAQISNPTPSPSPTGPVEWNNPRPVLDQGNYGTCVGNGWAQWGNTDPINDSYTEDMAKSIYYDATCFDGDCDSTYQNGSTVRSGAKAMQMPKRARLSTYAFASTVDDAITWIMQQGPVVFGTDFTWDMESPDSTGLVHPTGGVAGGHCYIGVGFDPTTNKIKFLNSWGPDWGVGGNFYMYKNEFEQLFADAGEACTAVELALA